MKLISSLEDVVVRTAVPVFFLVQGDWGRFVVVMTALKNVSSWRLNGAEKAELAQRVAAGEDEATVKRELQTKKAQANEDRKAAANAVAAKAQRQTQQAAKAKAKAGVRGAAKAAAPAPPGAQPALDDAALNDAANRSYYLQVQEDIASVLGEFGEEFRAQLPLNISGADTLSGVQAPFERAKARSRARLRGCPWAGNGSWTLQSFPLEAMALRASIRRGW